MYGFTLSLKDMFTSPLERIRTTLRSVNNEVDDLDNNINTMSTRSGANLNSLAGLAGKFLGAFATVEAVKSLFNLGIQAEQTKIKFEVLLGSAAKGKALLDQLNQYANITPFSNTGITKAAETMLGFGITQEKILPNMRMLGDIAQGNEQSLGSLSLVYSQIMATGKLMGQDLMQLIGQGFNPLEIISKKTGISMGSLSDKMSKGAISADMVTAAFKISTEQGGRFYKSTEKMSKTAGGKWSTFLGTLQDHIKNIGERFSTSLIPAIDFAQRGLGYTATYGKKALEIIMPFVRFLIRWKEVVIVAASALAFLNTIVALSAARVAIMTWYTGASTVAIILNTLVTEGWAAAWIAINIAMSANPIGAIIAVVVALSAAVVYAWRNFDWFRGGVMGAWEVLKGFGTMIKDYVINRINELMKAITGVGAAFEALKNGNFSKAFDIGKGIGKDLLGVDSKTKLLQASFKMGELAKTGYAAGIAGTPKSVTKAANAGKKAAGTDTSIFNSLLSGSGDESKTGKGSSKKGMSKVSEKANGIIGGGSKQTNISISIAKLQDHTIINVDSADKGLSNLGEKVQEILLRAVNSVNQMQTT